MTSVTRRGAGAALLALAAPGWAVQVPPADGRKVLRYAFPTAETSFDPARTSDLYSRVCTRHVFDSLFQYDYLARPTKFRLMTAAAMPEVADEYRTWTVRVRPGIFFADDPAFGGRRRELLAADYVYTLKRFAEIGRAHV